MNPVIRGPDKSLILGGFRSGKSTRAKHLVQRFPRFFIFDPMHEFTGVAPTFPTVALAFQEWQKTGRAIVQPLNAPAVFEEFSNHALRLKNTLIVVDEINQFVKVTSMPAAFSNVVRLCHKANNGLLLITHRLSDLPVIARYTQHRIFHRVDEWSEIKALEALVGPEAAETIRTLPEFHALYFGPGSRGILPPVPQGVSPPAQQHGQPGPGSGPPPA
jgi:DNA helicase HerA-like ATPase